MTSDFGDARPATHAEVQAGEVEHAVGADRRLEPRGVMPQSRRGWLIVLIVLAAALIFRVGVVMQNKSSYRPQTDALAFDYNATSIADGHGYGYSVNPPIKESEHKPSAFRAPLYPALLGAVYFVFGDHHWTMGRLVNAVIGTVLVALIGVIAAQLWSRRLGLIAMALAAAYPTLMLTGSSLQLEPLLGVMSLAAIACALAYRRDPVGWKWPILTGCFCGLAILARETGFFVLLPVAWLIWTAGPGGRPLSPRFTLERLAPPVLVLVLAAVVVVPWTIRNAVRFHAFVPVSTSSGVGLAGLFNDTNVDNPSRHAEWLAPWYDPSMLKIMVAMHNPSEEDVDQRLRKASIDVVRQHPSFVARSTAWNTVRLFDLDGGAYALRTAQYVPYSKTLLRLSIVSSYVVYLLAFVGALFFIETRRVPWAIWLIPILMFVFMVLLLPANVRYRSSLEPFFLLLATLPVAALWGRLTGTAAQWPQPHWPTWRKSRHPGAAT